MGILGSVSRYLKACGRLMYADPTGLGAGLGGRSKKTARMKYLELLEPRMLMTTVMGGEAFRYTDAVGNAITVTLSGNVIAELVGVVEQGGTESGRLLTADLTGQITSGDRNGEWLGNGSVPVDGGTQGQRQQGQAHITVAGAQYPDTTGGNPGDQMANLATLSVNAAGQIFTLNVFDINISGNPLVNPSDPSSAAQNFTIQVIQLNATSMAGTAVYTVRSQDAASPLRTIQTDTNDTYTYTEVGFRAAAFNPLNNQLYFDLHYQLTYENNDTSGTLISTTVTTVDQIFRFNPAAPGSGFTTVSQIDTAATAAGEQRQMVTAMTFVQNATASTTATLYIAQQPVGSGVGVLNPRLMIVNVPANNSVNAVSGFSTIRPYEGAGTGRHDLTDLTGLAALPGSVDSGGMAGDTRSYLYGVVSWGSNSHLTRIDVATGESTIWGNTTDLAETGTADGQNLTGLAFNPVAENPFTGELGALMSIDKEATNLDFVNHRLRVSQGDVFAVYSTASDIGAAITVTGPSVYTGDTGMAGTPANTGAAFVGYRGTTVAQSASQSTFVSVGPIASTTITHSVGVLPMVIEDLIGTQNGTSGTNATTSTLYAGLTVTEGNNLGRFLVDGDCTGRIVIPGSSVLIYAGWMNTERVYVGGDVRNLMALTNMEGSVEVEGRIGVVHVRGDMNAAIHAHDSSSVPGLLDLDPLVFTSANNAYNFTFAGSADVASDSLAVNTTGVGSVFGADTVAIESFTASFTVNAMAITSSSMEGGFAFVVQNQGLKVLGTNDTSMGYVGISQSAALGFTYDGANDELRMQLLVNGTAASGEVLMTAALGDGLSLRVNLTYQSDTLTVILGSSNPLTFTFPIDLADIVGGTAAYVGFTAAGGAGDTQSRIADFVYNGSSPMEGYTQVLRNYINGGDSFAAGFLVNSPFDNGSLDTTQYLCSLRNSATGQPDVMHLQGSAGGARWYGFALMAGQTVDINVVPRPDLSDGAEAPDVLVYDPDGQLIATNLNWADSAETLGRTLRITADRPGVYRLDIGESMGSGNWELTIKGAGNYGITAVVAAGAINLNGMGSVESGIQDNASADPSIWAESGDVGVILAGGDMTSSVSVSGLGTWSVAEGFNYNGSSSRDIYIPSGNLRAVVAGSISGTPELKVSGHLGLLATTTGDLDAGFSEPIGGNIQMINVTGAMLSVVRTNQAIGVVRAGSAGVNMTSPFETPASMLAADCDRFGADGIIDLIDVTGDWNGVPLITGPGGNIRFMKVGGMLTQDVLYNNGTTGTAGELVHVGGVVKYVDDSGASVALDPGKLLSDDGSGGTLTTLGTLTTRTYGVRGAGGVVILDVESTLGLTISATTSGYGHSVEVGTVTVNGEGVAIEVVNGIPLVGGTTGTTTTTTTGTNGAFCNVLLTSKNPDMVVNVFDINGTTIDEIRNTTDGEIYNVAASDVGAIYSRGNVGILPVSSTGVTLIPSETFGGGYPFVGTHIGVSAANIGLISANKAIGPILASGVIGTLTPNADKIDDPNVLEGLVGPISISGTAVATSSTGTTIPAGATSNIVSHTISITQADIGEGIPTAGNLPGTLGFLSGIYAAGQIVRVTGTEGDIRGNIVSQDSIGSISLTNGSIINTHIAVVTDFNMVNMDWADTIELPTGGGSLEIPVDLMDAIDIKGNGGIIGSAIWVSSINKITVASTGFGIINTAVQGVAEGRLASISAGGYGFRSVSLKFAQIGEIVATGPGTGVPLSNFSARLRASETLTIDPSTNTAPTALSDLAAWMNGDPQNPMAVTGMWDPSGTLTGQISGLVVGGQDNLGNVTAYDIRHSQFTFSKGTGKITVKHDAVDVLFVTATVAGVTIGNDATNFDLSAAGSIGPVVITGNFRQSTESAMTLITTKAQIVAKGAEGHVKSFSVGGDFEGLLLVQGVLGSGVIGKAGAKGVAGTGDLAGTITVTGQQQLAGKTTLSSLKIYGAVLPSAEINLTGNISTLDIGQGVSADARDITIKGNLTNLLVGTDAAVNGSDFGANLTVAGTLSNAVITGRMSGSIVVNGSLGKIAVNTDPATAGTNSTDLFSGQIMARGSLTSATIQGGASGRIVAGGIGKATLAGGLSGTIMSGTALGSATVGGSLAEGASVISSLGDIKGLKVTGDINGTVAAPNGAIASLSFTGGVGATGVLNARTIGAITAPGAVAGTINAAVSITSIKAASVAASATITTGSLASLTTTTGDMNGTVTVGVSAKLALTIAGNFGGDVTADAPMTVTVNGTMNAGASITNANALTSLTVKGAMSGQVVVDRLINAVAAGSMSNAVIVAGQGIGSLKVTGAMANSLVVAGLSHARNSTFEDGADARMGDIGTLAVGTMTNAIVTAGGNIGTYTSTGNMSSSSVSTGLVLSGTAVADVLADGTPLANATEMNAARINPTLLHGGFTKVSVGLVGTSGAATMFSSVVSAGVNPGTDGDFTTVPTVHDSLTGGRSAIAAFTGRLDGGSQLLAKTPAATAIPGLTLVNYTVDGGAASILPTAATSSGVLVATVLQGQTATVSTAAGIITITVTGPADARVFAYDSTASADRLDTLLISSTASAPITVAVTTNNPATFGLGRVITTDNTVVGSFTFNGDILGLDDGGPALWIDSDMTTFSVRGLGADAAWDGRIGGNVTTMTVQQFGAGDLRVGGRVNTLNVATASAATGALIANSIGTANLPAAFTGNIQATGGGGVVVNGIDTIKLVGTTGTFTGVVSAVNSIGSFTGTGVTFQGTLTSDADINSVTLTGDVGTAGTFTAAGKLNTFTLTGDFAGHITADSGTKLSIAKAKTLPNGNVLSSGVINFTNDLATLTIGGSDSGTITLGSNKTFSVTGTLSSTASVHILGTAGAITVTGGTQLGSVILAGQGATGITIGGTLAGVVGTRLSVGTVKLNNVTSGVLAVGGDLKTLTVAGTVSKSILSVGVWIGNDGIYNTADDVVYGGSLAGAKIGGVFADSAITAGVLPRLGTAGGVNNIPTNFQVFDYYANALNLADKDSAEAGGIAASTIQGVTFSKPIMSTNPNQGVLAVLVAADGITKVVVPKNTATPRQIVRSDPLGSPMVLSAPVANIASGTRVSFQSGVNGYSGSVDNHLPQNSTVSNTDGPILWVDANTSDGQGGQSLLRFENIIGDGDGQIPAGATLTSATLYFYTGSAESSTAPGAGGTLHRMLQTWTNTYNWFSFGDGIQANGVEAATTYNASVGAPNANVGGTISVNVLTDVQAWVNGTANYGWAILPWSTGGTDGWAFYSDSYSNSLMHEKLVVTYVTAEGSGSTTQLGGTRVATDEIRIAFDQPLDTATINTTTVQVTNTATGNAITDVTFAYARQTAADGTIQSVLRILSASGFGGATSVTVTLPSSAAPPVLTDVTGPRSSLLDYNQDGVYEMDPFGTQVQAQVVVIGS